MQGTLSQVRELGGGGVLLDKAAQFSLYQSLHEIYEQSFEPSPETYVCVWTTCRCDLKRLPCIALLCQSRRGISKGQMSTQEAIYANDTPEEDIHTHTHTCT